MPTVRAEFESFRREFAKHAERLVRMETVLLALHTEIKGNGQPGRCEKHESRLGELEGVLVKTGTILENMQDHGARLDGLEQERARLHGIMAAVGAIAGALGAGVIRLADKILK